MMVCCLTCDKCVVFAGLMSSGGRLAVSTGSPSCEVRMPADQNSVPSCTGLAGIVMLSVSFCACVLDLMSCRQLYYRQMVQCLNSRHLCRPWYNPAGDFGGGDWTKAWTEPDGKGGLTQRGAHLALVLCCASATRLLGGQKDWQWSGGSAHLACGLRQVWWEEQPGPGRCVRPSSRCAVAAWPCPPVPSLMPRPQKMAFHKLHVIMVEFF